MCIFAVLKLRSMTQLPATDIAQRILANFQYSPTENQMEAINMLSLFLADGDENKVFLLTGFAGTGKTTLIGALVHALEAIGGRSVLLAPTGRAAKVLSGYCGRPASTIHKKIYFPDITPEGYMVLNIKENKHKKRSVFIVDEASMIPDSEQNNRFGNYSGRDVLADLVQFIYNGSGCCMILVGDTAQLPPVGLDVSPALNINYLKATFHLSLSSFELTQVIRQAENSQILRNATRIRHHIQSEKFVPPFFFKEQKYDVQHITDHDMEDALSNAYSKFGSSESVIICRSNKRANLYNRHLRMSVYGYESQITAGDRVMIVKNNYFWLPDSSPAGFIANGDIAEIECITKIEERYGFLFADARIRLTDYADMESITVKLLLDTLNSESPNLPWEQYRALFNALQEDYAELTSRRSKMESIRNDLYFNALQVKFAYALTGHKTQGGQWKCVFVELGWLTQEHINKDFLRWLYTAVTRASEQLFLVNFPDLLFDN
jgi:exodeoxyribonuclease-5